MNGTQTDAFVVKPRVILELDTNGIVIMETYRNGQRQRIALDRGQEHWQMLDELRMQQKRITADAAEAVRKDKTTALSRHHKIWDQTRATHGKAFANATIGRRDEISRTTYGTRFAPVPEPNPAKPIRVAKVLAYGDAGDQSDLF